MTTAADDYAYIAQRMRDLRQERDPKLWETEDQMQRADEPAEKLSDEEMLALLDALTCA